MTDTPGLVYCEDMEHRVPHDLDTALAKKAAERAFEAYAQKFAKYQPTARWTTDTSCDISFSVKGITLRGKIALAPKAIEMDLEVPFLLRVFKGQAIGVIEKEIRKWLEKAKKGEL